MVSVETQSTVRGWLESLKQILHLDEIAQKLNISPDTLSLTLFYFALGLVFGFLYKRVGKQLVIGIVGCVVLLWVLSYFNLVSVHMDNFKALAGFSTDDTVGTVFDMFGTWVKEHVLQVVVGVVGFYLGSRG